MPEETTPQPEFRFPENYRFTLPEVLKLNNPERLEALRKEYVETKKNWKNYDRSPKKLMEMFGMRDTNNFRIFLTQSQSPETLNGAEMFAVLLEMWLEAECVKYAMEHGKYAKKMTKAKLYVQDGNIKKAAPEQVSDAASTETAGK